MPRARRALRNAHPEHYSIGNNTFPGVANVAIIARSSIFCDELRSAFESTADFIIVGFASHRLATLELIGATIPDLIVLDINIPGSGIETARQVSIAYPSVKILMLCNCDNDNLIGDALLSGACGCLQKGFSAKELLDTSRLILSGNYHLPPSLADGLINGAAKTGWMPSNVSYGKVELTRREQAILLSISQGRSQAQMSHEHGLSEQTIRTFISNIMQKLHVRNRIDAAITGNLRTYQRVQDDR